MARLTRLGYATLGATLKEGMNKKWVLKQGLEIKPSK
jgi:hypothetical protein